MAKRKQRQSKRRQLNSYQLDIVIPVYGQAELLKRCLDALPAAAGDIEYRLFLVDDCGPQQDELKMVYGSLNGNSRLIRNRENSGFAHTVNVGVSAGNAPLILLLNSDVILETGAIKVMLDEFEDEAVGVVGCKLIFADSRWQQEGKIQHAGIAVNIGGNLYHVNLSWDADHPKVNERREMQAVTGACLMTRRDIWRSILAEYRKFGDPTLGAMNEVYGAGTYEDIEYCFAARAQGFQVIYTPGAVGLHYVGASVAQSGGGYPIGRNAMVFGARCGHLVQYDEYKFL